MAFASNSSSSVPVSADSAALSQATRRSRWLKQLHAWHWISSAVCLVGMMLFAFTGITLNHAGEIEAKPEIRTVTGVLPAPMLPLVVDAAGQAALPPEVVAWLRAAFSVPAGQGAAEWSADEFYLGMPRPGGDAWLRIDLASGEFEYELTDRGWISWFNDLHKGRHTGEAWRWFIDIFSLACLVFSISGLLILKMHAANRPAVWPTVGLGAVIPVLLILLFVH